MHPGRQSEWGMETVGERRGRRGIQRWGYWGKGKREDEGKGRESQER